MSRLLFDRRLRDPRMVPTGPVRVNQGHPLARGLVGLWLPGIGFRDYSASGGTLSPSAITVGGSAHGPGALFNGTSSAFQAPPAPFNFQITSAFSVLSQIAGTTTTARQQLCGTWQYLTPGTAGWQLEMSDASPGAPQLLFAQGDGQNSFSSYASSIVNNGGNHGIVSTFSGNASSSGISWFVDGDSISGTGTIIGGGNPVLANSVFSIGQLPGSGGVPKWFSGLMSIVAVWNDTLPSAQAAALSAAPFSMLESAAPLVMWDVGASGATNAMLLGGVFGTLRAAVVAAQRNPATLVDRFGAPLAAVTGAQRNSATASGRMSDPTAAIIAGQRNAAALVGPFGRNTGSIGTQQRNAASAAGQFRGALASISTTQTMPMHAAPAFGPLAARITGTQQNVVHMTISASLGALLGHATATQSQHASVSAEFAPVSARIYITGTRTWVFRSNRIAIVPADVRTSIVPADTRSAVA